MGIRQRKFAVEIGSYKMKRAFLIISSLLITILISACAKSSESNAPGKNSNSAGPNATVAPGIPFSQPQSNELANTSSEGNIAMADRRKITDNPATGPIPPPPTRPAPENSEVSTTMGKDGAFIETRVFKDHPQILKMEKTWKSPKDSQIKIWLRNGKMLTIAGDKIESIAAVATATVLSLAGVKPPPPVPPPPTTKVNPEKLKQLRENQ